ncbi:hypothetical protein [Solitalea canadensis]|uniref:hypothetical protein n=1 Tax=Solitalea canadensis TaxID=995 RepID=UPI000F9C71DF|nr:hypothetical protein [Solitalea canadensis]
MYFIANKTKPANRAWFWYIVEVHNLPLLLMVGTDWVKNIRTNEVKWDANVNASTRFAINSEWQYMGTAVL